jgi:FtsZ-binding cell division protein ZapB
MEPALKQLDEAIHSHGQLQLLQMEIEETEKAKASLSEDLKTLYEEYQSVSDKCRNVSQ